MAQVHQVAGFVPSSQAFAFTNSFPPSPAIRVDLGPGGFLAIGDASGGLCGGMAFAVRDYVEKGLPIPDLTTPPAEGTPLFRYLVRRLLASWDVPRGVLAYARWMATPGGDTLFGAVHGVSRMTIQNEWPKIRRDLDAGVLCPLGLVTVSGVSLKAMGHNHQVLAYGYTLDADRLTLRVYDPNTPRSRADAVAISLSLAHPERETPITHNVGMSFPVRGFFATRYTAADPPQL